MLFSAMSSLALPTVSAAVTVKGSLVIRSTTFIQGYLHLVAAIVIGALSVPSSGNNLSLAFGSTGWAAIERLVFINENIPLRFRSTAKKTGVESDDLLLQ